MSPLRHDQLRSACETLGLIRADLAGIFDTSWNQVDKWWAGKTPVPTAVSLVIHLWLHPEFPNSLKPRRGMPYNINIIDFKEIFFRKKLRSGSRALAPEQS